MSKSEPAVEISPTTLKDWMDNNREFILVHTLGNDHFGKIHLPGAVNACVFEVSFLDQVKAFTTDILAEIVVYGSSQRSMDAITAAEKLRRAGYQNIRVLTGGIEAWQSAGFKVEGEAPETLPPTQATLTLENRVYPVDCDQSVIEWAGRNPNTTHFGNLSLAAGNLEVREGRIAGNFEIDMTSITNKSLEGNEYQPVLIEHLNSDDFFLTTLFPLARFEIQKATPIPKATFSMPNYHIEGVLDLRGVKMKQGFQATLTNTEEGGLAAEAHFDIDRTKWGLIYGSTRFFEHLGMHLIFDLISLQLRIVTT